MRAVLQRVREARVTVAGETVGAIGHGVVVLVAVGQGDTEADTRWLAERIAGLRVFEDEAGRMGRSLLEVGGQALVISQFTLYGDCRKGRRPSFTRAAGPERAEALYQRLVDALGEAGVPVVTGRFGAHMQVLLVNDGPVTLLLDSEKRFF